MTNPILSICITTYNRAEILDGVLTNLVPIAMKSNVGVIISDNGSNDGSDLVLERFRVQYDGITVNRNETNLGFDANFEKCVSLARSEYVWLMSDYCYLDENSLTRLLGLLESHSFDLVALNNHNRVRNVPSKVFTDSRILLREVGWHMTILDSLVVKRSLLTHGLFARYQGTMFAYFGVVFEALARTAVSVYWVSDSFVTRVHDKKTSLYAKKTVLVWCKQWVEVVFSLPPHYSVFDKCFLIRAHGRKAELFTIKGLLRLGIASQLSSRELAAYPVHAWLAMGGRTAIAFVLAILPLSVLGPLVHRLKKFRNRRRAECS